MEAPRDVSESMVFTGHVQGVGFRYTAYRIAQQLELRGHVRNAPDGSVETLVVGPLPAADAFVEELSKRFHVRRVTRTRVQLAETPTSFQILG
jgi:acylphosphatase